MDGLLKNLLSVDWWVGVFVCGIIINVLSAYVKPLIDKAASALSTKRKNKLEASKKFQQFQFEKLKSSSEARYTHLIDATNEKLDSINYLLFGILLQLFSINFSEKFELISTIAAFTALIFIFSSFLAAVRYHKMRMLHLEATNQSDQN